MGSRTSTQARTTAVGPSGVALVGAKKETSPSQERGEVSEGVGGSTGEEEHRHPLTKIVVPLPMARNGSEVGPKLEAGGISALFSPSSKSTQRPLRSPASVIVSACAPVIAPGGSPVVTAIDPTPPPAIILRILGGNAVELFRIYFGAFRTFRTTSTLRRRSFRRGSPSDHKASCRRETTDQAEQECTSFHKLFSIAPRCRSLLASSQVSRHAPGPGVDYLRRRA